jgi:nucleotide-binding universal stress UspA family protein
MYKKILLPADLPDSNTLQKAVNTAVDLARTYEAELHVVYVLPDFGVGMVSSYFDEGFQKTAMEKATQQLEEFAAAHAKGVKAVKTYVLYGTIYDQIIKAAKECGADLIVMGSHRPALEDYLIGPNAARVMRHAKQSVFIVRD